MGKIVRVKYDPEKNKRNGLLEAVRHSGDTVFDCAGAWADDVRSEYAESVGDYKNGRGK